MFEIIVAVILGMISFFFGYLVAFKKMYFLIAGYSDLKSKKEVTKNQIKVANKVALGCFVFGVSLIGLSVFNYFIPLFPKYKINLDFFFLLMISLFLAFLFPWILIRKG